MKKILLLLFVLTSLSFYAQLDREHWFAPMFDGQTNTGAEQFLHLSTNETTPFNVYVYNNNNLIYQKTISKGAPGVIDIDRDYIITKNIDDVLTVGTRGLYVKADKPCFANLRFGVTNHSEIITSKGAAGIGTQFYTVVAPNTMTSPYYGFSASFLATEDNTTVTVNNFKKVLTFTPQGNFDHLTFTLNKGESYIIDGRTFYSLNNRDGFIGAVVTSDKPISMTNGNFNGQYADPFANGSDILMDQSVPVDKLGDEFVIVKGYGKIGDKMEGAIIVATEPNTAIYLNGVTTPAKILVNPGDYELVSETNYVPRGNEHYNLHIKTDKNVYVYQLLGGVEGGTSPQATGGMNYIPPLNCYLPRKIDEISYISRIGEFDPDDRFLTKLNIITQKGAVVKVNGTAPNPVHGPYDISTIPDEQTWVTYSIPNVTGNITVESSKAVTAGIASGNAAFGYGGYFAGFSRVPLISLVDGSCLLPGGGGVTLAVTEGFESYEWYNKENPTVVLGTKYFFYPQSSGVYYAKIKEGSCGEIQTPDYKFFNCDTYTNIDYKSCGAETITPTFALSSQTVDPKSIVIVKEPTQGNLSINTTDASNTTTYGKVIYTANPGASGIDTFKFSFCGISIIRDCEEVQITIKMIEKKDITLQECSTNGSATYKLSTAAVTPDTDIKSITYFHTPVGATNNTIADLITDFDQFNSTDTSVYARIKNNMGCIAVAKIDLRAKLAPNVQDNLYTNLHCDEDIDEKIDGIFQLDVTTITPFVLAQASDFIVKYYDTENKAIIGGNNNIAQIFKYTPNNNSVWIRVDAPNGCPFIIKEIKLNTGTKLTINTPDLILECDNDLDNSTKILLSDYSSLFTTTPNTSVKIFANLTDAENNTPETNYEPTISGPQTFYYRFKNDIACEVIGTLNISLKQPKKSEILKDKEICPDPGAKATLDVEADFAGNVVWSNGETSTSIEVGVGEHWADLTFDGCVYRQFVSVTALDIKITNIEIKGSTVTVSVTGGTPPYQYAMDNLNYQPSNVFTNVRGGDHTIYAISSENCDPAIAEINVIEAYNVITPNGDGINDVLNYSDLLKKEEPFLQIFDRLGKTVFTGDNNNKYSWDGKSSGKTVSTGSYWYIMKWREPGSIAFSEFSGWILVKNRD